MSKSTCSMMELSTCRPPRMVPHIAGSNDIFFDAFQSDLSAMIEDYTEEAEDCNEEQYLRDPEQRWDYLPQPYRRIDRILFEFIDEVWDLIDANERHIIKTSDQYTTPKYKNAASVPGTDGVRCLADTPDKLYLVMAGGEGLSILQINTQDMVVNWSDPADWPVCVRLTVTTLAPAMYLICTQHSTGAVRVFAFAYGIIHPLHTFSDFTDEAGECVIEQFEISSNSDYLTLFARNVTTTSPVIEVYKLPKEGWLHDLEVLAAQNAEGTSASKLPSTVPEAEPTNQNQNAKSSNASNANQTAKASTTNVPKSGSKDSARLSSPTPKHQVPAVLRTTPQAALIDVGTSNHLTSRSTAFNLIHKKSAQYLAQKQSDVPEVNDMKATVHFVTPGRLNLHGVDNTLPAGQPCSVLVWWTGTRFLLQYSLLKNKEADVKPDMMWPISSNIVASAITSGSTYVALATQNNGIIIINRLIGSCQNVVHVMTDAGRVTKLVFLEDPDIPAVRQRYRAVNQYQVADPETMSLPLLVCTDSGELYTMPDCLDRHCCPMMKAVRPERPEDMPTHVQRISGQPALVLLCTRGGAVYIHDVVRGTQLCQLVLPESLFPHPDTPALATADNAQLVYIAAGRDDQWSLYVYKMWSQPLLDTYRAVPDGQTEQSLNSRNLNDLATHISTMLNARHEDQEGRRVRLQRRWSELRAEMLCEKNSSTTTTTTQSTACSKVPVTAY